MTRTISKPVTMPVRKRQLAKIRTASTRAGVPVQDVARMILELGLAHVVRAVEGVAK
jgi:hypothetical protein